VIRYFLVYFQQPHTRDPRSKVQLYLPQPVVINVRTLYIALSKKNKLLYTPAISKKAHTLMQEIRSFQNDWYEKYF